MCFMKKSVLKNFAIFTGKLPTCNFFKKRLQHRCFPLNIANLFEEHLLTAASDFLKQLQNTNEQLLLDNILKGYENEQLNYEQLNCNLSICASLAKNGSCYIKIQSKIDNL